MADTSGQDHAGVQEDYDCQSSQDKSVKSRVYDPLNKNPLLTAKPIAKLLGLPYKAYGDYLAHLRSKWKSDYQNSQGLKCLSFHAWHGWIYALKSFCREEAVRRGWVQSRAKNHYIFWKDKLGRLEWHESGRIKVWARKPVTKARLLQLLANTCVSPSMRRNKTHLLDLFKPVQKVLVFHSHKLL